MILKERRYRYREEFYKVVKTGDADWGLERWWLWKLEGAVGWGGVV